MTTRAKSPWACPIPTPASITGNAANGVCLKDADLQKLQTSNSKLQNQPASAHRTSALGDGVPASSRAAMCNSPAVPDNNASFEISNLAAREDAGTPSQPRNRRNPTF